MRVCRDFQNQFKRLPLGLLVILASGVGHAKALDIQFDFSRDTTRFFAEGTEGRRILESAAAYYESALLDQLGALIPAGVNTFTVDFLDPPTQALVEIARPPIPANTVVVYVGASNIAGTFIGSGWHGGIYPSGTNAWLDYVDTRGQAGIVYGAGANEVAPWGGSITVDTLDETGAPRQWDYSLGVRPADSGLHLYSLLIHELAHVLGFGICDSWKRRVDANSRFTGAKAVAANGGAIQLDSGRTHWNLGTTSLIYGTAVQQKTAMDPILIAELPSYPTALDMAGLADIGWNVAPALPAPLTPVITTTLNPGSTSMTVGWQGSSLFQYTLLTTTDLTSWRATGPTLAGSTGSMQMVLPIDGLAKGYRLLVENRAPSATGMALGRSVIPAAANEGDGEVLKARAHPGNGAMQGEAGRSSIKAESPWCGGCSRATASMNAGSLRGRVARR